jgi:hypothetical protein
MRANRPREVRNRAALRPRPKVWLTEILKEGSPIDANYPKPFPSIKASVFNGTPAGGRGGRRGALFQPPWAGLSEAAPRQVPNRRRSVSEAAGNLRRVRRSSLPGETL